MEMMTNEGDEEDQDEGRGGDGYTVHMTAERGGTRTRAEPRRYAIQSRRDGRRMTNSTARREALAREGAESPQSRWR